ncbi:MAG: SpoIID/LytB domain-containing protein [Firmicutes bacterium]|jgi:stage II sporulation protein D|nr:SpoIID/LytB domain-containing protein [Bacillota bacterium]
MNKVCKKIMLLTAIVMLCSSIVNITAFAYTVPETIHIGLSNIGSAITLSNKSINVGAEENGTYVSGGTIKSEKGFTFSAGSGTYGAVSLYYDNYESAKQNAATIANALPAYTGGGKWQIYVSGMTGEQVRQKTGLPAENVSSVSNMILVQSGGKTMFITNMITPQFGAADNDTGVITINNKEYRGKIQPTRVNGGSIIPVNAVSIEEYLYGVVPSEMSPSYAEEALKAQAVAARTYAIKKMDMKVHENKGYDLCDGTHCQSYKGKSAEFPATNAAVDATKGLVIYHKGEPIEAVFFASSGGYTENSEDIWTAPLPYLKAVPDVYEVDTNTWTKKITAAQLTNLASAKGDNIGQVTDMVISKVSLGGRIQELKLVGTKGTKVLTRDQVRTYFSSLNGSFPSKMFTINGKGGGPKTTVSMNTRQLSDVSDAANVTNSPEESIADNYVIGSDSLLFPELETYNTTPTNVSNNVTSAVMQRNVTVTGASSGAVSTNNGTGVFVIEGKGNGHGAGLSQKGAQGLALQGSDFLSILYHYYTDVTIE